MEHWEIAMLAVSILIISALATFYALLVAKDGKRGSTLYTLPYRTLRWLGVGGKFWRPIPEKL